MTKPETISLHEQLRCIDREIGMRQRVYPGWVRAGRMDQAKADFEIAAMKAVQLTLMKLFVGGNKKDRDDDPRPREDHGDDR